MKKTLLITLLSGAVVASSFAQGVVNFSFGGGKLQYSTDGVTVTASVPKGNPDNIPGYGQVNVSIYSAASGTQLGLVGNAPNFTTAWSLASTIANNVAPAAGDMGSTSVTLSSASGSPGSTQELELVAWTGTSGSFTAALASGTALVGWEGSTLSGGGLGWSQATGTSQSPVFLSGGSTGFAGTLVLTPVPEPTTIALGGLGAAALLLFRRRK